MTDFERTGDPTVVFLHIPKTAGTTLERTLVREYGSKALFSTGDDVDAAVGQLNRLDPAERRAVRVIHGHMAFGIHEQLSSPVVYLTMLRHPVDRVISHYYYVRRRPHHHLHETANSGMSLREYVETGAEGRSIELDNGQTRLLSGRTLNQVGFGQCSREMLEVAKRNLETHFGAAGVSERFDESLLVFRQVLGWRIPFYVRRNVTRNRPSVEEVDPETLRVIEEHNRIDLELYQYVTRRLDERLREAGRTFPARLRSFQFLNGEYNRLRSLRQRLTGLLAPV